MCMANRNSNFQSTPSILKKYNIDIVEYQRLSNIVFPTSNVNIKSKP